MDPITQCYPVINIPLYGLYWNTLIKEPVSIKGAEVPYLRGHQRVYLNPQCSVYITLKQDPVSFSCRLLHTKHSFCVLTCFLLNLVRHAKLHTRNYWRQRSSQYLSLKQHFVNVFKSGKAQNCSLSNQIQTLGPFTVTLKVLLQSLLNLV